MSGDGIYSRHLTRYPSPGRYRVSVSMSSSVRGAYTVSGDEQLYPQPSGYLTPACCGSAVRVPEDRRLYLGYFSREMAMDMIIMQIQQGVEESLPPARIVDFTIVEYQDYEMVVSWTAPGDDFTDGNVEKYFITFFSDIDQAMLEDESLKTIDIVNKSNDGERVIQKLDLRNITEDCYAAVRAVDEDGNMGKMSNLVRLKVVEKLPKTDINTVEDTPDDNDTIIVITVVCITLVILAIVLTIVMLRRKAMTPCDPVTKSHGVTAIITTGNKRTRSSSFKLQSRQGSYQPSRTSFINNITPTFWSASQLVGGDHGGDGVKEESDNDTVVTAGGDSQDGESKDKEIETIDEPEERRKDKKDNPETKRSVNNLPSILKHPFHPHRSIPV